MKRVLSGIQPSGEIHIGNYLGAIKQWVAIGEKLGRDAFFCIVDYHALTNPLAYDPSTLAQRTLRPPWSTSPRGLTRRRSPSSSSPTCPSTLSSPGSSPP